MAAEVTKQDQALTNSAGLVATAHGDLTQQLSVLRGKISSLQPMWKGAGAAAFQQVMVRWDEDSRKITSALNEFEANLRQSEQVYNATDDAQSATFAKLNGRLG